MKKIMFTCFFAFCLISANCFAQSDATKVLEKNFTNIQVVELSLPSGCCYIEKNEGTDIRVLAAHSYKSKKAFETTFKTIDSVLLIKEKIDMTKRGFSVWKLMVPENTYVKIYSGSGTIKINNIVGRIKINSISGNIFVENVKISGNSEFESQSGSVNLTLEETPKYNILLSSESGIATLNLKSVINGKIEMKAQESVGEISCPFKFDKEWSIIYDHVYYMKSLTFGSETPVIRIFTYSGKAVLEDQINHQPNIGLE